MKVHVVMGNDYPAAVFSTEEGAEAFIKSKQEEQRQTAGKYPTRIYWRSYDFELQGDDVRVMERS